jgi:hypothetical protein
VVVVLMVVALAACSAPQGPNDPALVAQIGMPDVRAAWREADGTLVVVTGLRESEAAELCSRILGQLGINGIVAVRYPPGWWPWDEYGEVRCIA